jgi:phosphoenolpyruvate carboxykinase (ATP)
MSKPSTTIVNLESIAAHHLGRIQNNLPTAALAEDVVRRSEGYLSARGGVTIRQGQHTERELDATYVVAGSTQSAFWLVGDRFAELGPQRFESLSARLLAYLRSRDLYVQDIEVGDAKDASQPCRILTETAWHSLVARTLYRPVADIAAGAPHLTVVHAPGFGAVPQRDGTRGTAFTIYHPAQSTVYVCGSAYGGELRKAVSTLAGMVAPESALPLRGAVNVDADGNAALFLGRTGTGKTTLALDGERRAVADHAVSWTDRGLKGFERGVYASVLGLDPATEPAVHRGTQRFGCLLENVALNPVDRQPDFADASLAVNTRAAFRVDDSNDAQIACGHPKHVFLLTRDTAGVLPPIARLTPEQAVFAFLISYTSSLTDTEAGQRDVRPDVEAALEGASSALSPAAYASHFLERIQSHGATCWFVNTGWVGEPAGRGERIDLGFTRALIRAAVAGDLDGVEMEPDPLFLYGVPQTCPGVDAALLNPRVLAADSAEYEIRANLLATAFIDAFTHFAEEMPASVADMVDSVVLFEDTLDVMENFRLSF